VPEVLDRITGEMIDSPAVYWERITKSLREPFHPEELKFRIASTSKDKQRGLIAPYVDSRSIQKRFDEVLGIENWQNLITRNGVGSLCNVQIWDPFRQIWLSKMDGSGDTEIESFKGSISGAQKRAAQQWGVGTYLYHLPNVWIDVTQRGNSYVPADGEINIVARNLPKWALPGGKGYPEAAPAGGSGAGNNGTGGNGDKVDKYENWKKIVAYAGTKKYERSENEIRLLLGIFYPTYDAEWVSTTDWGVKRLQAVLNAEKRVNLVDEFERIARDDLDGESFEKFVIEVEEFGIVLFGVKSTLLDDSDKLKKAIKLWGTYKPKKNDKAA